MSSNLFSLPEEDRMPIAKILAMFDEFPFLHRYVKYPLHLYSVKVSRINGGFLLQRAEGKRHDNWADLPYQLCQTRSFIFLDRQRREIGQIRPWTWLKNIRLRRIFDKTNIPASDFHSSNTLMEIFWEDKKRMECVHNVVEILEEEYVPKGITIYRCPKEQTLRQMIEEEKKQYQKEISQQE